MTLFCRCIFVLLFAALCGPAFAQPHGAAGAASNGLAVRAVDGGGAATTQAAPPISLSQPRPFQRYAIGTYESPLGFGGRIATSITSWIDLRVGGSFFSFSTDRTVSGIPFTANVLFQSEEAQVDWYPFHGGFHVSPGLMFGSSNRVYGSALIPAGESFTLNDVTYYSGGADPVHASGFVRFRHTAPMLTVGWGNWVRRERQGHWTFPFEMGAVFWGEPNTAMNFSGEVCTDPRQIFCHNITTDASVQANIKAERDKLQKDANWLSIYPVIAGGVVYRF